MNSVPVSALASATARATVRARAWVPKKKFDTKSGVKTVSVFTGERGLKKEGLEEEEEEVVVARAPDKHQNQLN